MKFILIIIVFSLAFLSSPVLIHAQCILRFSGRITDADTREILDGAEVQIKEIKQRKVTGKDGSFSFQGLCSGSYDIEISHAACKRC